MKLGSIFRSIFNRWVETSQTPQISSQNQAPNHIPNTLPNIPSPILSPNSSSENALAQNFSEIMENTRRIANERTGILNPINFSVADIIRVGVNLTPNTGEGNRRSDGQMGQMSDHTYSLYLAGVPGEGNRRSDGQGMGSMDYRAYRAWQERENSYQTLYNSQPYNYQTSNHQSNGAIDSLRNEIKLLREVAKKSTTENLALKEKVSQQESEIAILRERVKGEVHGIKDLEIEGDTV